MNGCRSIRRNRFWNGRRRQRRQRRPYSDPKPLVKRALNRGIIDVEKVGGTDDAIQSAIPIDADVQRVCQIEVVRRESTILFETQTQGGALFGEPPN